MPTLVCHKYYRIVLLENDPQDLQPEPLHRHLDPQDLQPRDLQHRDPQEVYEDQVESIDNAVDVLFKIVRESTTSVHCTRRGSFVPML